jgi:YHS domain-containing protein
MKNISLLISFLAITLFTTSCSNHHAKKNIESNIAAVTNVDTVKFTPAMVDNKRDPSCGMPVAAGIGDTAHYKNKVLGFCSKDCKDEFLKDPEKNITAADLKK